MAWPRRVAVKAKGGPGGGAGRGRALLAALWFANLWVYRTLQFLVTLALI